MLIFLLIAGLIIAICFAIYYATGFYQIRTLMERGNWTVRHYTYGGTRNEWHYMHCDSSLLKGWSLSEAYERQMILDKARRLDVAPEALNQTSEAER